MHTYEYDVVLWSTKWAQAEPAAPILCYPLINLHQENRSMTTKGVTKLVVCLFYALFAVNFRSAFTFPKNDTKLLLKC